ncbi:hypothetical protein HPP92_026243 [Vanilla planifolia]|uniref:Uncharacterized protein n=1 Tax=Vanilla planifolia TaxID=51239 RepID=A0A835PF37_VANPL|nr:hypothetical protein HPP92_026243 [Vanilla planifolia]
MQVRSSPPERWDERQHQKPNFPTGTYLLELCSVESIHHLTEEREHDEGHAEGEEEQERDKMIGSNPLQGAKRHCL